MSSRLRSTGLILTFILLLPFCLTAKPQKHYGQGFTIDLDEPYDRVLKVVESVTQDGLIRGTSEYKGNSDLYGANPRKATDAFRTPPAPGTVFYKERANSIAPDHFYGSNDEGVVTVRYVVQALGAKSTRLTIDAIFVENNHHHSHTSDGTVENAEFLAISDEIKDIEDKELKQRQDAEIAKEQEQIGTLQTQVDEQNLQLKAVKAKEQDLEQQLAKLQPGKPGKVRTASADLKAEPYNQSKTLKFLSQDEDITILQRTRSWYRVQASDGQKGWVYALMLEVKQ